MTHLLDTDTCIALMRGRPAGARTRFAALASRPAISSIVVFELRVGIEKTDRRAIEEARLQVLLSRMQLLAFEVQDAEHAARLRAAVESGGSKIGAYDTLLAGQSLARGLVLVTGNTREFGRVEGLQTESWFD
jgi:tRNA(fMet)-specific endonuclease VapC